MKNFLDALCGSKSAVTGVVFLSVILLIVCFFYTFSNAYKNTEYRHSDEKYKVSAYLTGTSKYYNSTEEREEYQNDWQYEINGTYHSFSDVTVVQPSGTREIEVYRNADGDFVLRENHTLSVVISILCELLLILSAGFVIVRHELLMGRRSYQNR